jgi:hypothetical protein
VNPPKIASTFFLFVEWPSPVFCVYWSTPIFRRVFYGQSDVWPWNKYPKSRYQIRNMDQIILWFMVNGSKVYIYQIRKPIFNGIVNGDNHGFNPNCVCVATPSWTKPSTPRTISAEFRWSFPKMGLPQHGCTKSWCNDLDGIGTPMVLETQKNLRKTHSLLLRITTFSR